MGTKFARTVLVTSIVLIAMLMPDWAGYSFNGCSSNQAEWKQSNPLAAADEPQQPTPTPEADDEDIQRADPLEGGLEDAVSITEPVPLEEFALEASEAEEVEGVVLDVPAYTWWRGSGPTAAGMVIGYWDAHGFDDLVPGSAETQTEQVNAVISSQGNWEDYCLPLDDSIHNLKLDKSEPPDGDEHPDDSLADFMKTSQSAHFVWYGVTPYQYFEVGIENYVRWVSNAYHVSAKQGDFGNLFTWDDFRNEIDAGRPLLFWVDSSGDGVMDRVVAAIGYSTGDTPPKYAALNTWDREVHWYNFAEMAPAQPYGIHSAILVNMSATPILANDEFENATIIEALPFADQVYTEDATSALDDPIFPCNTSPFQGQGYYSIWYQYTPAEDQEIKIDTFGSGRNNILGVWTGTRGNLTNVACNDNAWEGTFNSKVTLAVSAGETYYIEVADIYLFSTIQIHVGLNIDTEPPETFMVSSPTDITKEDTATFGFSGTDDFDMPNELIFECRLDDEGFSPCTSPQRYTSLADGTHVFEVRAIDQTGKVDPTPASHTWIIDTIPPVTIAAVSGTAKAMCPSDCYFASATVTLNASDSGSGIMTTRYRIRFANGTDSRERIYREPLVITTEGINTVEFYSKDNAYNYEDTKSISVKITTFPSTDVLDNFNRRDGPLGYPWLDARRVIGYRIVDQQAEVVRGGPLVWLNTYGADQEAFFNFERVDGHALVQSLLLKVQAAVRSGVEGIVVNYSRGEVTVGAYSSRGSLTVYDRFPVTLSDGDHFGARAFADGTVVVYVNCLPIGEVNTNIVQQGGRIGVLFFGAKDAVFDDFGGGDVE